MHSDRNLFSGNVARFDSSARSVRYPYPNAGFACARASMSSVFAPSGEDHSNSPSVDPSTFPPGLSASFPVMLLIACALSCLRTMLSGSPALEKQTTRPFGFAFVDATDAAHVSQSLCSRISSSITRSLLSPRPARLVGAPTLYCLRPVSTSFLLPFVLPTRWSSADSSGILS